MDFLTIYTVLTTIGTVVFGYLNYRKTEVIALGMEIVRAYADKNVSEEEYKLIVDDLEAVLYKK